MRLYDFIEKRRASSAETNETIDLIKFSSKTEVALNAALHECSK